MCCLAQSADGMLPELHSVSQLSRVDQHQHMKRRGSSFLRLTSVIAEGRSICIKQWSEASASCKDQIAIDPMARTQKNIGEIKSHEFL